MRSLSSPIRKYKTVIMKNVFDKSIHKRITFPRIFFNAGASSSSDIFEFTIFWIIDTTTFYFFFFNHSINSYEPNIIYEKWCLPELASFIENWESNSTIQLFQIKKRYYKKKRHYDGNELFGFSHSAYQATLSFVLSTN